MKSITATTLYNITQDNRHYLAYQLSEASHVLRGAFELGQHQADHPNIIEFFIKSTALMEKHFTAREKDSKMKPIRRVVLLGDAAPFKDLIERLQDDQWKGFRVLCLERMDAFQHKYPFLMLQRGERLSHQRVSHKGIEMSRAEELTLYAHCQFPHEVLEDRLFIGTNSNAKNKRQLADLKISRIVDLNIYLTEQEQQSRVSFPEGEYISMPVTEQMDVDFRDLQLVRQGRVLLFCRDGDKSLVAAIAFVMLALKCDMQRAAIRVFQAAGKDTVCKWLFDRLLRYQF